MESKPNSVKLKLISNCKLIIRAFGILNKLFPNFWIMEVLCLMLESGFPYFGLFMSSLIINELAGACEAEALLRLAGITVLGSFLLGLIYKALKSKQNVNNAFLFQRHEAYLFAMQRKLQYAHLENPELIAARFRNLQNMSTFHAGLSAVKIAFTKIVANIFNIVLSVSLTFTMFSKTADHAYTGIPGLIQSPAAIVFLIFLIMISTICSVMITLEKAKVNNKAVTEAAQNASRQRYYNGHWGSDMITFGLNKIVMEEFRRHLLHPKWIVDVEKAAIKYNIFTLLIHMALTITVFIFTAAKAFMGTFGIGNFILYQGAIDRFVKAVCDITSDIGKLIHNNKYLIEFYAFIDLPDNMYHGSLAVEHRDDIDYEIEFRDVGFQYPRSDSWALRHVNIKFKIGDTLAIVGENGSGKTTFIKLLCRLYDPTEGKILLNGIDISRYRYHEYMELFSVVFQDFSLFGFPLGENVAANHQYNEAKVRDCLIRAGFGEKLKSLEHDPSFEGKNALHQAIGRNYDATGIDFSGGELQKIALARALYKDAPFMILDEPTAALDPIAEASIYENFRSLVKEKTAIFISHRLSSCRFCDEIAVFDHGQLIQRGSHDMLLSDEQGKYSQLWHAQAKYYM